MIEYASCVSDPIKGVLQPRFEAVRHLFPGWCEKVVVYWDKSEAEDTILTCHPKHEYRVMSITVHPLFLEDVIHWKEDLIHEIQHALLRPYIAKVDRIVEKFIRDEAMIDFINDEMAEAEEAVCEDLAIFASKLEKPCQCTNLSVKNADTELKNS